MFVLREKEYSEYIQHSKNKKYDLGGQPLGSIFSLGGFSYQCFTFDLRKLFR